MISYLIDVYVCDLLTSLFGFLPIPGAGGAVGMACMDFTSVLKSIGL